MKRLKKCIGILLLLAGLAVFLSPDLYSFWMDTHNQRIIADFQETYKPEPPIELPDESSHDTEQPETAELPSAPVVGAGLRKQIQAYNERIFAEKQSGITDAWTFTENPFGVELDDDLFGYIEIPTMNVSLPLYIGATNANMSRGAVVLGQTSLPIGGKNTNSVIAGHRGYQGVAFFREIENLAVGDSVSVTNPWETLTYTVTGISVIQPDDLEAVRIQPGKDMLTLVTCHPYRSHGRFRYIAYCERSGTLPKVEEEPEDKAETSKTSAPTMTGSVAFVSSEPDIQMETLLRFAGAAVILLLLILTVLPSRKPKTPKEPHPIRTVVLILLLFSVLLILYCVWSVDAALDEAAREFQAAAELAGH